MLKPPLALSTCWNSFRHMDGYAMLREIADLGFTHAELSHGVRMLLLPGVIRAVNEGVIKISSVHNFCPLPMGVTQASPNLFEPSALSTKERIQWLRHTKRSLDFAHEMKARVMVLHLGSVKFFWLNPARKLHAFVRNNPDVRVPDDSKYKQVLKKACSSLRSRMVPYWKQVKESVEEIRLYAAQQNIQLGFENREKFEELPLDDDFEELIAGMAEPNTAGYWHDTGHADIKQSMGMLDQKLHLQKYAGRLLGFHLHDVTPDGKDHQPIGNGHVDFEMVSSFWKPEHLLTLELSPRVRVEDVVLSKQRVEALIAARFGATN